MHCIFCCSGFARGDLPARALGWLEGAGLLVENEDEADKSADGLVLKKLPPYYVTQMLERGLQNDFIGFQDERLKRVTVFRELNE